ncbi:MAG: TlyA family RNA methyltransferase [Hyphomicrobiaceae bacterium]
MDQALVERGLARSRSQARDLVKRGCVTAGGAIATKAGLEVGADIDLQVAEGAQPWVSRGGLKLAAGLDAFGFDPQARIALDVGASTGGFTQVLSARGAARVYAVDIGSGQLAPEIAADPRVIRLEHTDARRLTRDVIPEPVTAVVADVSFISLTSVLPVPLQLAAPGAWLVALIKPQFEVGREHVGKGGIVRSDHARAIAIERVCAWINSQPGWRTIGTMPSPVRGGSGNQEMLVGAVCDA